MSQAIVFDRDAIACLIKKGAFPQTLRPSRSGSRASSATRAAPLVPIDKALYVSVQHSPRGDRSGKAEEALHPLLALRTLLIRQRAHRDEEASSAAPPAGTLVPALDGGIFGSERVDEARPARAAAAVGRLLADRQATSAAIRRAAASRRGGQLELHEGGAASAAVAEDEDAEDEDTSLYSEVDRYTALTRPQPATQLTGAALPAAATGLSTSARAGVCMPSDTVSPAVRRALGLRVYGEEDDDAHRRQLQEARAASFAGISGGGAGAVGVPTPLDVPEREGPVSAVFRRRPELAPLSPGLRAQLVALGAHIVDEYDIPPRAQTAPGGAVLSGSGRDTTPTLPPVVAPAAPPQRQKRAPPLERADASATSTVVPICTTGVRQSARGNTPRIISSMPNARITTTVVAEPAAAPPPTQPRSILPPIFPSMLEPVRVRSRELAAAVRAASGGSVTAAQSATRAPPPGRLQGKAASAPAFKTTAEVGAVLPDWLGGAGGIDVLTFRELSLHPFLLLPPDEQAVETQHAPASLSPSQQVPAAGAELQMPQTGGSSAPPGVVADGPWWDEMLEKRPPASPSCRHTQTAPGLPRWRSTPHMSGHEQGQSREQKDQTGLSEAAPTTGEPAATGLHIQSSYASTPRRAIDARSSDDDAAAPSSGARRYNARRRLSWRIQLCEDDESTPEEHETRLSPHRSGLSNAVPICGDSSRRLQELWIDEVRAIAEAEERLEAPSGGGNAVGSGAVVAASQDPAPKRRAAARAAAQAAAGRHVDLLSLGRQPPTMSAPFSGDVAAAVPAEDWWALRLLDGDAERNEAGRQLTQAQLRLLRSPLRGTMTVPYAAARMRSLKKPRRLNDNAAGVSEGRRSQLGPLQAARQEYHILRAHRASSQVDLALAAGSFWRPGVSKDGISAGAAGSAGSWRAALHQLSLGARGASADDAPQTVRATAEVRANRRAAGAEAAAREVLRRAASAAGTADDPFSPSAALAHVRGLGLGIA